jgi:hypothetical protein
LSNPFPDLYFFSLLVARATVICTNGMFFSTFTCCCCYWLLFASFAIAAATDAAADRILFQGARWEYKFGRGGVPNSSITF